MVPNPGKCLYIVIGDIDPSDKIISNDDETANCNKEKLLGFLLDSKLNFDSQIASLCKETGQIITLFQIRKSCNLI